MVVAKTASKSGWHTEVSSGAHTIASDTTEDKGGANLGMRPHELLASALASCVQMTLRMAAAQRELPLEEAIVEVELERGPSRVTFRYSVELTGPLSEEQRRLLLSAAERCPVRRTLSSELCFESA